MNRRTIVVAALAAATLGAPAAASAHVTLQPNTAASGGFTRMAVRVPNEKDDAGTKKVEVQMPPGFLFVSYEKVPGWTVKVKQRKLSKPVTEFGEKISEEAGTVTFTSDGKSAEIAPGQFQDFGLSVGIPKGATGSKLTFKALQTYDDGDVVRWIGPPSAEHPAPQVTLTPAVEEGADATASAPTTPVAARTTGGGGDDDDGNGLAIAALIVGGLGLIAGIGGVGMARKAAA